MEKTKFEFPIVEVININNNDVITTSMKNGGNGGMDDENDYPVIFG